MSPFAGFDLEASIAAEAARSGVPLSATQIDALAAHARAVEASNARLHLTAIVEPGDFVVRHIGESLVGAALLDPGVRGTLVDLGSGNGYPGIPLAIARPGLRPVLVEASPRKAAFLVEGLRVAGLTEGRVIERNVQRPSDLEDLAPLMVLASRAMGGWERLIPKLAPAVAPDGSLLLWAGGSLTKVLARTVWRRWRKLAERPLPGMSRGRVAHLGRAG